ncbi:RDD family protein [Lysobacter sp. SG-8]|uniref:RDD family protein n=1 Tax=Marilutibacter penaei TaxID=2759900 RepID=A0A7W3U4I3_9GAMM|nr:RDD family protein [Lysobacter penaei]
MTAPARFWPRSVAWSLDMLLAALLCAPWLAGPLARGLARLRADLLAFLTAAYREMHLAFAGGEAPLAFLPRALRAPWLHEGIAALHADVWTTFAMPLLLFVLVAIILQALGEASPWQGGPGKRLLGLRVATSEGGRLTPGRALSRQLAGVLSWLTLNVGHALAAVPPAHAALHDRLTGTRVVGGPQRLPAWGRAWLALLGLGTLALVVVLSVSLSQLAEAALTAALG